MHLNQISPQRPSAAGPARRRPRWWPGLAGATLTACLAAACPAAAATAGTAAAGQPPLPLNCGAPDFPVQCYAPHAYEVAYGVAPLLRRGIDGRGQTVVLPELAEPPSSHGVIYSDIRKDLAAFDTKFALPAATLQVVNTIARSSTPYLAGTEEVEDTEMVHAFAPAASLDVVLVPQDAQSSSANFAAAMTKAIQEGVALNAAVISISASGGEHLFTAAEVTAMNTALMQACHQHVTVVAASGDTGAISDLGPPQQVSLPASDPLVLAVGGTTLDATLATGAYHGEMAWNEATGPQDSQASGGGYSSLFPRPAYQNSVAPAGANRGVPDVSANANSNTAMAMDIAGGGLLPASGTSAATPLWAGVIALADQQAGQHLGFINPAIYHIASGPAYHNAFHDVITGDNSVLWSTGVFTGYTAGPGWDPVTGWGSPDAQYLIPLLARTARSRA